MTTSLVVLIGLLFVSLLSATVSQRARRTERGFVVQYGWPFKMLAVISALLTLVFVCAYFVTSVENRPAVLFLVILFTVISVPLLLMVFVTRVEVEVEESVMILHSPWRRGTRRIPLADIESVNLVQPSQRYEIQTKAHGSVFLHKDLSGLGDLLGLLRARMQMQASGLESQIAEAAQVMVAQPDASESDLALRLVAALGDRDLADRMLEFLPLAFGRVVLARLGVTVPDSFIRAVDDENFSDACPLDAEPLWLPAKAFAARASTWMANQDFLAIARRSAEFDAVNNACNKGSDPKNLVGGPPVFTRVAPLPEPR